MNKGWIKIWRSLSDWEWSDVPEMMALWIHLILSANYEQSQWHGITIGAGQLVTTYHQLSVKTGLSEKQVRTCLSRLLESQQIGIERAGKRQLVTICNYALYQASDDEQGQEKGSIMADKSQEDGNERADEGQTKDTQRATVKEIKNIINQEGKNIYNPLPPFQGVSPQKKPTAKKECKAVTRYDSVWEDTYYRLTGDLFVWAKRENVSVQSIVGKITKMMEDQGKTPTAEEKEAALRWYLEQLYALDDPWIKANFSPHVIDGKFNEYYQTIKLNTISNGNRKRNTNPAGVSADYVATVVGDLA